MSPTPPHVLMYVAFVHLGYPVFGNMCYSYLQYVLVHNKDNEIRLFISRHYDAKHSGVLGHLHRAAYYRQMYLILFSATDPLSELVAIFGGKNRGGGIHRRLSLASRHAQL